VPPPTRRSPPEAAREFDILHAIDPAQVRHERSGDLLGVGEPQAMLGSGRTLDALGDQLLGTHTEPGQLADATAACGTGEILEAANLERLVQGLHALRPQSFDTCHRDERRRHLGGHLVEQRQAFGPYQRGNLPGQVVADAWQLGEVDSFVEQLGQAAGMAADEACCVAVSAHAERVRALELERVGQLLEAVGDLSVLNRHGCQVCRMCKIPFASILHILQT
jgi:hypothetical protein